MRLNRCFKISRANLCPADFWAVNRCRLRFRRWLRHTVRTEETAHVRNTGDRSSHGYASYWGRQSLVAIVRALKSALAKPVAPVYLYRTFVAAVACVLITSSA